MCDLAAAQTWQDQMSSCESVSFSICHPLTDIYTTWSVFDEKLHQAAQNRSSKALRPKLQIVVLQYPDCVQIVSGFMKIGV